MKKAKKTLIGLVTLALSLCVALSVAGCDQTDNSSEISAYESKIEQLEKKLADTNANTETDNSEIAAQIDELKNKLADLQSTHEADTQKIGELEGKLADLGSLHETDYVGQCYEKIKYIDKNLSDRDALHGENFKAAQQWIKSNLVEAGYDESAVEFQPISFNKYAKESSLDTDVCSYTTDGKKYTKNGRKYVEDENGEYVYATITTHNIVLKKQGKSGKQIIAGAHYDGDGTGDNGSGISLLLTVAQKLVNVQMPHDIVFIFFTAEEYGCYGSTAYADAMTPEEVENTLYMINLDSLICGDYCYLYGGVQDDATQTVSGTAAFENAMKVAESLGLEFKNNPWTYEKPEPGHSTPDYATPTTGDWSDHKGFKNKGIEYVYFEATNWEIPDYSGYGETYLIGMLMNTKNDYLEYIETYFPGRAQAHLDKFFKLLNALLVQNYKAA